MLQKWLDATRTTTFDELVNLIAEEEVQRRLPLDILMHVKEAGDGDFYETSPVTNSTIC